MLCPPDKKNNQTPTVTSPHHSGVAEQDTALSVGYSRMAGQRPSENS
jgi:hypothetical protein